MRPSRRRLLVRRAVVALLVVGLVVALVVAVRRALQPAPAVACEATVAGRTVTLTPEQAGNAGTIAGVAVRRGLPARAITIALATALQESKLVNVRYGDRDSLGLFQQRPSQGWGTKAQVLDPVHAASAFYDVLVKIDGYRTRPITQVAQRVQRSGFPEAYAQHEDEARVLASALSGASPAALVCVLDPARRAAGRPGLAALQAVLAREQPAGATRLLTSGVRLTPAQPWAAAQWAVARSDQLGVSRVYVGALLWSRAYGERGWTTVSGSGVRPGEVVVMLTDAAPGT